MNFCGLISEFNPFHNGHEYIIKQAKAQTGKEIICLTSGDFVQRGTPAIESKYERAKKAIQAGANAVLELPVFYACSNAENFATGAIKIFKELGIDTIAFGIENTNLETLQKVAKLKHQNSTRFQNAFKNEIQNGINYNTALKRSISETLQNESIIEVLNKPNNILAIEYLTAILKLDAKITPIAINRTDNGYNSNQAKKQYLSASAIRELIKSNHDYLKFVPTYATIKEPFTKKHKEIFDALCTLTIRQKNANQLNKLYDYNEGIEYRIKEMSDSFSSFDEIKNNIITPRYRLARVNKLLIYPLLNISKKVIDESYKTKPAIKVLAIAKSNKSLLTAYNKKRINLVVCNNDYNSLTKKQKDLFDITINASNIYCTITNKPNNMDKKIGTMFL